MHAMLDIETLGLSDARDFVITQIAMVAFFPYDPPVGPSAQVRYSEVLKHSGLYMTLDIQEQLNKGAKIEADTMIWWMSQDQDVMKSTFEGPRGVVAVLEAVERFIRDYEITHLWGNGNTFDNMALRNLFRRFNYKFPLSYKRDMDLRTLRWMAQVDHPPSYNLSVPDHNPHVDCCKQIVDLWFYLETLARRQA